MKRRGKEEGGIGVGVDKQFVGNTLDAPISLRVAHSYRIELSRRGSFFGSILQIPSLSHDLPS